ncbi:hypothetical protein B0H12DRAFT_166266 [Mycena haematopus]|nr:hypothetical protein B0H12DRAFT_166266 [Mycena haematopus]
MASSTPLVWLITGSSSGFGRSLVASVLARGDRVIATARSLESISHLQGNPNVRVLQLDVTAGASAIAAIVNEAATVWGRLDVLVNNAGVGYAGLLEEAGCVPVCLKGACMRMSLVSRSDLLRKQFDVNFFGVMDVCSAGLPHLRAQKSGTIVVIGSRSAWKPEIPGLGPYASSKAAVHALAETLAVEVAPHGVRLLLVEPGGCRTNISTTPFFTKNDIADYDKMRGICTARFGGLAGTEPGDPAKAMEAVVDVVRGENTAQGRPWPGRLVLGDDAVNDVRVKCKKNSSCTYSD